MAVDAPSLADVEFPIGHYRVLSLLGRGGIGEVFVAHRRGSTHLCALKRLRAEVASKDIARIRIKREAHLAAYLDHPNICRVLDAGYEDDCFFIATEFVAGVDLERIIQALAGRNLALAVDMVLAVALPALAALEHAHTAVGPDGRPLEVVHRDLSPRNIMVTFDGVVKIIDFGVAKAAVDDYRTAPGVLVGTPKYLSPEQALGVPVDARSDLYSLAAVIYEMLAGRGVVRGTGNLMDTLQEIIAKPPRPVSEYNPQVPKVLEAALERALAKEPEDRYASAEEMQVTLRTVGGPPASTAQLGRLVREMFPEVAREAAALAERAREAVTPTPRPRSVVDPFSTTAVSQIPDEAQLPTRAGQPEDPRGATRTALRAELGEGPDPARQARHELAQAELRGETVLRTRATATVALSPEVQATLVRPVLTAASEAAFLPTRTAPRPSRSPAPSLSGLSPPRRSRGPVVALAGAALAVSATLVALALSPRAAPVAAPLPDPVAAPAPAATRAQPGVTPRAELPPEAVRAAPRSAERAPAPRPHPPPTRTQDPTPRPAVARTPAPRAAADPLARRLGSLSRTLDSGEALDPGDLAQAVEQVMARAEATGDEAAQREARAARDCLDTCPDQDRMLAAARRALRQVLAAEAR
jgi:serine/threonine protein kinase